MNIRNTQSSQLVGAMLEPGFYPHGPPSVELRDTHISWVFLAGKLAYKVKKPLTLPFLDYGTVERRHQMCREEVRLNRRLAPQIYLGVVAVARSRDSYTLSPEADPAAVEYAVEMRRVEEGRSLAALATRGELTPAHVAAVAGLLARFHAEAPASPAKYRDVGVLVATLDENLATLREAAVAVVGELRLDAAEHFTHAFVGARRNELEARAQAGLVREGHGDLRAEHVIVPEAGPGYVYDCVEFNPALRHIDVAADISFLVMDLARLGGEHLATDLLDGYRRAGGDPGDDALASFFASYRAWVRAKIAALRLLELGEEHPERPRQEEEARGLLRLGHRFAWFARRPLVLVICGVAGTGKTTLARVLAEVGSWPYVSSDVTRKRLAGLSPTERAVAGDYSHAATIRTYRELGGMARTALEDHGGVIIDATFHLRSERDAFRAELGERRARVLFVECRTPRDELFVRIREREQDPNRVSDAGVSVVERQLREHEPLDEVSAHADLATDAPPDELVVEVERLIDRYLWPGP